MRKLLSLLSVLTVGTVATTNVVACSNKSSLTPADQTNLPFLYHVAQVTNLGQIKGDASSILAAFKEKNSNIDISNLKVTNINSINKAASTATINVDQYNTKYKKGTLNVIFNISKSTELKDLITVTNLYVNRNVNTVGDIAKVSDQDIINGINESNGLSLKLEDFNIITKGEHKGGTVYHDNTPLLAVLTGKQNYQGTITLNLNTGLDLSKVFSNTDIGTIFLPQALLSNWSSTDPMMQLTIKAMLIEYIGDANPLLGEFKDVIANLQFTKSTTALTFNKTQLTLDARNIKNNELSEYFKNSVSFTFIIEKDSRLKINDAIKTADLGAIKNIDVNTIKDSIIDKNQAQLKQYDRTELERYLVVTVNDDNKSAQVSWLPGSKEFLGHDPLAFSFAPPEVQKEIGKLDTTVNFTVSR